MRIENYGSSMEKYIKKLQKLYKKGKYEDYEDKIIKKLTAIDKQVLEEVYIKERLIKELANKLEIKEPTCRKRAQVLRNKINKELKEKR